MTVFNQQTENVLFNDAVIFAKPNEICVIHQENDSFEIIRIYNQSDFQEYNGCFTFLG